MLRLVSMLLDRGLYFSWSWRFGWPKVSTWRYFKDSEVIGLEPELVSKLDSARHIAGVPFVITSGRRTVDENEKATGVDRSAHIKGLAVDLRLPDSPESLARFLMVNALLQAGFKRVGVYDHHLHCDIDNSLPTPRMWIGTSH